MLPQLSAGGSVNTEFSIQTYSGRFVDPFNPDPESIRLCDMVQSMAYSNRFTGHTRRPVSTLRHSLLVASLVPPDFRLAGLTHDCQESYVNDLPSPIKRHPDMRLYREAEDSIGSVVAGLFGVDYPMHPIVKEADQLAVVAEATYYFHGVKSWKAWPHLQQLDPTPALRSPWLWAPIPIWLMKRLYVREVRKYCDPDVFRRLTRP